MRATGSWHGDVDTGKASVWGNEIYNPERLKFFDRHLKGITAPEDDPPVRLYVLGTGDGTKTAEGHLNHGGYWRDEAGCIAYVVRVSLRTENSANASRNSSK